MMSEQDKADMKTLVTQAVAEAVGTAAALEQEQISKLVKMATEEAITETFKVMGIDVNDFDHINDFRENQSWVKKYRKASETIGSRILITITTVVTGGIIAAVWAYIQTRGN